jgi:hypothetical protein
MDMLKISPIDPFVFTLPIGPLVFTVGRLPLYDPYRLQMYGKAKAKHMESSKGFFGKDHITINKW